MKVPDTIFQMKVQSLIPVEIKQKLHARHTRFTSIYDTAAAVYVALPDPKKWTKKAEGILCLVQDQSNSVFIASFDPESLEMTFCHELYFDFSECYRPIQEESSFYCFQSDICVVGLSFPSVREAEHFSVHVKNSSPTRTGFFTKMFKKPKKQMVISQPLHVERVSGANIGEDSTFELGGSLVENESALEKILGQLGYTKDQMNDPQIKQEVIKVLQEYTYNVFAEEKKEEVTKPTGGVPPPPPPPPPPPVSTRMHGARKEGALTANEFSHGEAQRYTQNERRENTQREMQGGTIRMKKSPVLKCSGNEFSRENEMTGDDLTRVHETEGKGDNKQREDNQEEERGGLTRIRRDENQPPLINFDENNVDPMVKIALQVAKSK